MYIRIRLSHAYIYTRISRICIYIYTHISHIYTRICLIRIYMYTRISRIRIYIYTRTRIDMYTRISHIDDHVYMIQRHVSCRIRVCVYIHTIRVYVWTCIRVSRRDDGWVTGSWLSEVIRFHGVYMCVHVHTKLYFIVGVWCSWDGWAEWRHEWCHQTHSVYTYRHLVCSRVCF